MSQSTTITFANNRVGHALEILKQQIQRFMELNPTINVELVALPNNAGDFLPLYLDYFEAARGQVDVFSMDIIAASAVAEHAVNLNDYFSADEINKHFAVNIQTNTVDGRLVALPWYVDVDVLYYRKDLLESYQLEIPQTWDALAEAAKVIQEGERAKGNDDFHGFVWSGQVDESLTCNALLWQASSGGGFLLNPDGSPHINNAATMQAWERATQWIGTISPAKTPKMDLVDILNIWHNKNAAFMHTWFYVHRFSYRRESPLNGLFDIIQLPGQTPDLRMSILGGWQLVVSQYSQHIQAATELVRFLSSPAEQKFRAMERDDNPSIAALYDDVELLASYPYYQRLGDILAHAISRPTAITRKNYSGISTLYSEAVHGVLTHEYTAQEAVTRLEGELKQLLKS